MNRSLIAVLALVLMATNAFAQARPSSTPRLQGVWRIIEFTTTGPNAAADTKPAPGLWIFTAKHYSLTRENAPRPNTVNNAESTVDDLRNILRFSAQAGTYEMAGGDVVLHRIAALQVSNMAAGNYATNGLRFAGDTLWMTLKANQEGPAPNPSTYKLLRVE